MKSSSLLAGSTVDSYIFETMSLLRFIYCFCYFSVEFRNLNASIVIESSHPKGEAVYILTTKSPYLITSAIKLSAESKYFELDRVYNSKYCPASQEQQ